MTLSERLLWMRKQKGLSQETLAERIGVSRQAVSKWETGLSNPDINNLILLSEVFEVSLDELIKGEAYTRPVEKETIRVIEVPSRRHYEYKSKHSIGGLPLVHINFGWRRRKCRAKGIIAIGNVATGVIAVGLVSVGVLSFGSLSLGILALGGLAAGLFSLGGIALGIFALGGLAVGMFAAGGCAIASHVAIGGYARGHIAAGDVARGVRIIEQYVDATGNKVIDTDRLLWAVSEEYPELWGMADFLSGGGQR